MPSTKRSRPHISHSDSDDASSPSRPVKQPKSSSSNGTLQKDENGDPFWPLKQDDTRRVTVNEFKGKMMVNIREYYDKDGRKLPGKKGISLPVDQFIALVDTLPQIEEVLRSKGVSVPHSKYGAVAADDSIGGDKADESLRVRKDDQGLNEDDEEDQVSGRKKNIDSTSEEE